MNLSICDVVEADGALARAALRSSMQVSCGSATNSIRQALPAMSSAVVTGMTRTGSRVIRRAAAHLDCS